MDRDDVLVNIAVAAMFLGIFAISGLASYGVACLVFGIAGWTVDIMYLPITLLASVALGSVVLAWASISGWFDTQQRILERGRSIHAGRIKRTRKAVGIANKTSTICYQTSTICYQFLAYAPARTSHFA